MDIITKKLADPKSITDIDTDEIILSIKVLKQVDYKIDFLSSEVFSTLVILAFDSEILLPFPLRKFFVKYFNI